MTRVGVGPRLGRAALRSANCALHVRPVKPDTPLLLLRLVAAAALAVSVAMLWDYLAATPSFCTVGSACAQVRAKAGMIGGWLPVPALGVAAFGGLFVLSAVGRARRLAGLAAILGGVVGVGLVAYQALLLHAICPLCVVVDSLGVVGAGVGIWVLRAAPGRDTLSWIGDAGLVALAVGVPLGWVFSRPPEPVPAAVAALQRADVVTIVEFSDFECPYCRRAHPELEAARGMVGIPTHLERRSFPLPMHPNARFASRAWVCAEKQGKGDPMADRLFAAEDIGKVGCEGLAEALGLDMAAFRGCVGSSATEARIEADIALIKASGFRGLPTVWIGDQLLAGARDRDAYAEAIRRVAAGTRKEGKSWPLVAAFLLGGSLLLFGRRASEA